MEVLEILNGDYEKNRDIPADGNTHVILIIGKSVAWLPQENNFCIIHYRNFQQLLYFLAKNEFIRFIYTDLPLPHYGVAYKANAVI